MTTILISRSVPFHVGFLFETVLESLDLSKGYTFSQSDCALKSKSRSEMFIRYQPSKIVGKATGFKGHVESEDAELIIWRSNSFKLTEDTISALDVLEGLYGDLELAVVLDDGERSPEEYREYVKR